MAMTEKPSRTVQKHLRAIRSGTVTRENVIGIRKLLNGASRRAGGLSVGMTTPLGTLEQANEVLAAIRFHRPRVTGRLHDSGRELLRNPRYSKRFTDRQKRMIADEGLFFRLLGYDWLGSYHTVPVFQAVGGDGGTFIFRNVPWQSGGNGPQVQPR